MNYWLLLAVFLLGFIAGTYIGLLCFDTIENNIIVKKLRAKKGGTIDISDIKQPTTKPGKPGLLKRIFKRKNKTNG